MKAEKLYQQLKSLGLLVPKREEYTKRFTYSGTELIVERYGDRLIVGHYYEQNGDLVPDPEVVFWIDDELEMAKPIEFSNFYIYQSVEEEGKLNTKLLEALYRFSFEWLREMKGSLVEITKEDKEDINPSL